MFFLSIKATETLLLSFTWLTLLLLVLPLTFCHYLILFVFVLSPILLRIISLLHLCPKFPKCGIPPLSFLLPLQWFISFLLLLPPPFPGCSMSRPSFPLSSAVDNHPPSSLCLMLLGKGCRTLLLHGHHAPSAASHICSHLVTSTPLPRKLGLKEKGVIWVPVCL